MEPTQDDARLSACEEHIGYRFKDRSLLALALTHASDKASHMEPPPVEGTPPSDVPFREPTDNERLEFRGDSVLGMIVCEELFKRFPDETEGQLTNVKSVVVSRTVLARITDKLGIATYMSLGKGMTTYARLPESLRANVFEAVVAAIYLDGGLDEAKRFVLDSEREFIQAVEQDHHHRNFKSTLQQFTQREFSITPTYRVTSEEGPDHIKEFEVVAVIGDKEYATGRGKSKKDAEQEAAKNTLAILNSESVGDSSPQI
jgi:ribonuclease-3